MTSTPKMKANMKLIVPLLAFVLSAATFSTASPPWSAEETNTTADDAIKSGRGNPQYGGGPKSGPNSPGFFYKGG